MADAKISALTSLTGAGAAQDDLLAIVDTSAATTKKITREEFFKSVDYISFDTTNVVAAPTEGQLTWDTAEKTLSLGLNGGNTVLQLGQETHYRVHNNTGAQIPDGTVVRFSGVLGSSGIITVAPALADGTYPSSYIIGVTTENISHGADGLVTCFGKVRGINTSGFSVGDILYASPTVAGGFTNVKPEWGNNIVSIAAVLSSQTNNGIIFVRPHVEDFENVTVTPQMFGAVMDGVTDDAAAINAALDASDDVLLLDGSYMVKSSITMYGRGKKMRGVAQGTSTLLTDVDGIDIIVQDSSESQIADQEISHLRIAYTGGTRTSGAHIRTMKYSRDMRYKSIGLRNVYDGFRFNGLQLGWIDDLHIEQFGIGSGGKGRYGINFDNTGSGYATDVHISNAQIAGYKNNNTAGLVSAIRVNKMDGVYVTNSHFGWSDYHILSNPEGVADVSDRVTSLVVSNTYFDTAYGEHLQFTGAAPSIYSVFKFSNCVFRDARGANGSVLANAGVSDLHFDGCLFWENAKSGIRCGTGVSNLAVTGCQFKDNNSSNSSGHGDVIFYGSGASLIGNTVTGGGASGYGFAAMSTSSGVFMHGNNTDGSTAGTPIYVENGATELIAAQSEGSAALPSVAFRGDADTGLFHPDANQIGFATGGVQRARLSTTALQLDVPLTGLAVTQSATDATAGRQLKVGDSATLLSASPALRCAYGGTANAITLTSGAGFAATPTAGLQVRFRATATNTGAATLALDGCPVANCVTVTGAALPAGYIRTNVDTVALFDGANWMLSRAAERGSNANGDFLRLETGSLICDTEVLTSTSAETSRTWPAAFSIAPRVLCSCSGGTVGFARSNVATATAVEVSAYNTSGARIAGYVTIAAFGRWY